MTENVFIIYLTMAGMVLTGAGSGILIKLTDATKAKGEYFEHPFFQCLPMFIGEMMCIVFHWIHQRKLVKDYGSLENSPEMIDAKAKGLKVDFNPLMLWIPTLLDLVASVLLMIGYINVAASIAQMIGSLIVFVTALEAIFFLKKVLFRHNWVGAIMVVIGICLVALSALLSNSHSEKGNALIGVTVMVLSAIMQGTQFVVEEKMMSVYYLNPFQFVGWQGIWGLLFTLLILPILQLIPCTSELWNNGYVENSLFALEQIFSTPRLMVLLSCHIICICLYNGAGMVVTKMVSSTNRVVLRQLKIVLIWLFFLLYPYHGNESFKPIQFMGFLILVFGVLLYNEVIILHWWGMADHLLIQKDAEDKHEYVEFEETKTKPT